MVSAIWRAAIHAAEALDAELAPPVCGRAARACTDAAVVADVSTIDVCVDTSADTEVAVWLDDDVTGALLGLVDALLLTQASSYTTIIVLALPLGLIGEHNAANALGVAVRDGLEVHGRDGIEPGDVNEEIFASRLDTAGLPDPDLVIRTSGEQRISNFLPWQSAYAEMVFMDVLWPDVDRTTLWKAIEIYNQRERRFGKA